MGMLKKLLNSFKDFGKNMISEETDVIYEEELTGELAKEPAAVSRILGVGKKIGNIVEKVIAQDANTQLSRAVAEAVKDPSNPEYDDLEQYL